VFHRTVSGLLQGSKRLRGEGPAGATVVADARSPRAHQLRSSLAGLGIPHRTLAATDGETAAVTLADGQVLTDPGPAELTRALGFPTELDSHEADLVVVGAGPAGLSAAVYGASEGLRTTVLDAGAVGGQAGSSSLIRNYLGFPRGLGGGELAQRAYQQAWLFGAQFRLTHRASSLEPRDGRHVVRTDTGAEIAARAVVLALGVEYRRLEAPGLTELEGAGVFYGASMSEAQALAGESVYIVGGGNSAGQAALHLSRYACKVRILVRGDGLAATMSQYLIDTIDKDPNVQVRTRTEVVAGLGDGRLEQLRLRTPDGIATVSAAALVVLIGAHPHTEWLPDEVARDVWGYVATGPDATGWPLERAPLPLETSLPGVFAAGDVRSRSVKRVASAAGSGALAVSDVHTYLALEPAARWPVPR
jgi:thioredoxin reductase (NADPH)